MSGDELTRLDDTDDAMFYQSPRFVQHESRAYLDRLSKLYEQHLQAEWSVLDLCSSWDSHLPEGSRYKRVVGHGMNAAELVANSALDEHFVRNLNSNPTLPFRSGEFDVALCSLGFPYLTQPLEVCQELHRVLAPGGRVIITFGAHTFAEKATAGWLSRSKEERIKLVARYLEASGFEDVDLQLHTLPAPASATPASSVDPGRDPATIIPVPRSEYLCMAMAHRPGLPSLQTLMQEDSLQEVGYVSPSNNVLHELELRGTAAASGVKASTIAMWVASFSAMREEAMVMGIPESALPELPPEPGVKDIRDARTQLSNLMASFLSAGL